MSVHPLVLSLEEWMAFASLFRVDKRATVDWVLARLGDPIAWQRIEWNPVVRDDGEIVLTVFLDEPPLRVQE